MGDDIEASRSTGSDYWAALLWLSKNQKQMTIDDKPKPKPMSSPNNKAA